MILGIDFSLNGTGLSMIENNKVIDWRLFTRDKKLVKQNEEKIILIPEESFTNQAEKLDWVCHKIEHFILQAQFVALEQQIGLSFSWADGYALLKYFCRRGKVPYIMIAPTTVKKYAGSGSADKTQMGYYLRRDYNLDFDYLGDMANNVVDATWIALIGNYFRDVYLLKNLKGKNTVRNTIIENLAIKNGYLEKKKGRKNGRNNGSQQQEQI